MTIQILQYEFLGPIKLDEWGPPMEKVVYLILSRSKDSFNIIYAGECEKTEDKKFFLENPDFKCWIKTAGSESYLYLAILPMFESSTSARKSIMDKIVLRYKPSCNPHTSESKPSYIVRSRSDYVEKTTDSTENKMVILCPNCSAEMKIEKILENNRLLRCPMCGFDDVQTSL